VRGEIHPPSPPFFSASFGPIFNYVNCMTNLGTLYAGPTSDSDWKAGISTEVRQSRPDACANFERTKVDCPRAMEQGGMCPLSNEVAHGGVGPILVSSLNLVVQLQWPFPSRRKIVLFFQVVCCLSQGPIKSRESNLRYDSVTSINNFDQYFHFCCHVASKDSAKSS
jgi:hypothetical protein